jgi:hypothetical protein
MGGVRVATASAWGAPLEARESVAAHGTYNIVSMKERCSVKGM